MEPPPAGDVAVVIPARNESDRIAATVRAAAGLAGVDLVVVVDDGAGDGTADLAEAAGASVMRHARPRGKAAAMETGAEAVRLHEAGPDQARPLAPGFGVETGLTIDLLRQGLRIEEVEVPLAHRATGRDWRSQAHRARQFADVARALAARQVHRPR